MDGKEREGKGREGKEGDKIFRNRLLDSGRGGSTWDGCTAI